MERIGGMGRAPPALVLAALEGRQAMFCQDSELLFHPFDLEGDVAQALAVVHELFQPGVWRDQFQDDLPEW